jgi:hypothetical protein
MTHLDDDDDDRPPRLHIGDLGTILLAGVFLVGMLFMIFAPSPFEGVFKKQPEPKADNGEVSVTLPAKE